MLCIASNIAAYDANFFSHHFSDRNLQSENQAVSAEAAKAVSSEIRIFGMSVDKIALLLKYGADVNARDHNGYTPLSLVLFSPFR